MSSKRWQGGSTGQWRAIRAAVLTRDKGLCQLKIPGVCTTRATQVHHRLPREKVGDNPEFLVSVCQPCNIKAGDPGKTEPAPRIEEW